MATKLNVKVININTNLCIRKGPGTTYAVVGGRKNGSTFVAVDTKKVGNITWYKESDGKWSAGNSSNGKTTYIKIVEDLSGDKKSKKTDNSSKKATTPKYKPTIINSKGITINDVNNNSNMGIPKIGNTSILSDSGGDYEEYFTINSNEYPKEIKNSKTGKVISYDYAITIPKNISETISDIKHKLGVPSAYSRNTVNRYTHNYFNRYRMEFPDLYLQNTKGVIIFTKPDLNIFTTSGGYTKQFQNDERSFGLLKKSKYLGALLTSNSYNNLTVDKHNFNPLLSNLAQNVEVSDDSVDSLDTGENFIGYKMQYAKHNVKSLTSGQISIRFKETFNLSVTSLHQIWVDYESNVYMGIMSPKDEHIWNKELDYACNIYYFLLAGDGETILFWTKYYGCYPVNVPKSSFSFDYGSEVSLPDVSVSYNYIYKSDLSNKALVEFNMDGGTEEYKYLKNHDGYTGLTSPWAGVPYIDKTTENNGTSSNALVYKLKYRYSNDVDN